jgi:hypothetical protein
VDRRKLTMARIAAHTRCAFEQDEAMSYGVTLEPAS